MKFEQIEEFTNNVNALDKFSCFDFLSKGLDGADVLFLGTTEGHIYMLQISKRISHRNNRPIVISDECIHMGVVTVITYSAHPLLRQASKGYLISGSSDRTIKIWNPFTDKRTYLIQTLYGHQGTITALVDGKDGTILSTSVDGTMRIWAAQKGRQLMLNPFFENTFCVTIQNVGGSMTWCTAIVIHDANIWLCYLGDTSGNIEVYRKSTEEYSMNDIPVRLGGGGADKAFSPTISTVTKHRRWENVHRLGIIDMVLVKDQGFLASIAYDGTCQISDASTGQPCFTFNNPRLCSYKDILHRPGTSQLLVSDELGFVEILSIHTQDLIQSMCVQQPTAKQSAGIQKCHRDPILGSLRAHLHDHMFFSFHTSKGSIILWQIPKNMSCFEFGGHDSTVVGLAVLDMSPATAPPDSNDYEGWRAHSLPQSMQISADEKLLLSAARNSTVKGWDDGNTRGNSGNSSSRFFKCRSLAEMVCSHMLWGLNALATGHEDGTLCLWNCDSGYRIDAKNLKSTVTSLCDGKSLRRRILLGADTSGYIALWNLSLLKSPPVQIPLDHVMKGFHSADDPGILSLAYHSKSESAFSGGLDTTVRSWRLRSDWSPVTIRSHKDSVTILRCQNDFLLSGDEASVVFLWKLYPADSPQSAYPSSESVSASSQHSLKSVSWSGQHGPPRMVKICKWRPKQFGSLRALDLNQVNEDHAVVSLSCRLGRSFIFSIKLIPRETTIKNESNKLKKQYSDEGSGGTTSSNNRNISFEDISYNNEGEKLDEVDDDDDIDLFEESSQDEEEDGRSESIDERSVEKTSSNHFRSDSLSKSKQDSNFNPSRNSNSVFTTICAVETFQKGVNGKLVQAELLHDISHENQEPSCAHLKCTPANNAMVLYIGTVEGGILRYSLS